MPVGAIGFGSMGMGVARSLPRSGLPVSGYDVRAEGHLGRRIEPPTGKKER
jgi:3-hydroxyisobutyrate dehydrogenase-like beta-hydroxyacid dehydrogenase